MSENSDVAGSGLPPSLVDVWRQERVQQRTVKQIVDPVPLVPSLHDVVPQMDFLAPLDFRDVEQVIEVPKIVCPSSCSRTVLWKPQKAEHLVEVPTVLSYSSLQQLHVEQIVDIPAPGRAGGRRGPWRSSRSPWTGFNSVFGADRVDIPGEGLQGSRPGQGSASSSSSLDHAGQGFFRTFPRGKKVRVRSALGVGIECGL